MILSSSRLLQDARFAARALRRQPGLAAAAILTLALGIGVNTGVFSLVDSLLLTPPPLRDPASLVVVWGSNPEAARAMGAADKLAVSAADFHDLARTSRTLTHLSFFQRANVNLSGTGEPEQLLAYRVTGEFFDLLGTPAALGRTLSPVDDTLGQPAAVVLSHAFWQHRFGGDRQAVGRTIMISGLPMTVVGVMPAPFRFPGNSDLSPGDIRGPDIWMPTALGATERLNRGSRNAWAFGRLHPGVTLAAAQAEIDTIYRRLQKDYPGEDAGWGVRLSPLSQEMVANLRPVLLLLWAAVGLILLIACANVANLLLARATSRQREIAVRAAIGASCGQLLAQLLTESLVLSLTGSALGLALGKAGLAGFASLVPVDTIAIAPLSLSPRVLAFSTFLCLAVTLLAGLAPALHATRPDLAVALRGGTRTGAGLSGRRMRNALVAAEVALAFLLLIGAGLLLRSFAHLLAVDPGFRTERALTLVVDLPRNLYPEPRRRLFADRVLDHLRTLPGVTAAGAASEQPLAASGNFYTFLIEGRPIPKLEQMPVAGELRATPGYLEALGVPLRAGRTFTAADGPNAPLAAVIDTVMAETYWPRESPLGKRIRLGLPDDKDDPWYAVVGVVGSVRNAFERVPRPQMYRSAAQHPPLRLSFLLRTAAEPRSLLAAARAAVREADPGQPISREATLKEAAATTLAGRRFSLSLLGLFAALALLLCGIGIYGVTAYSVTQRTREIGLRLALGAQRNGVLRLVMKEAGALVGLGLLAGLGATLALTRLMSSLLYGVAATDPVTFVAVAAVLTGLALAAAWLPGRRAMKVDPMVALREE